MRSFIVGLVALALASGSAAAKMVEHKLGYSFNGQQYQGVLVYDDAVKTKRPAIFMQPDWEGVSDKALEQARTVAGKDYVVYVADMFGVGYKPKTTPEMMAASRAVHDDLAGTRAKGDKAADMMLAEAGKRGLIDTARIAAIGFCYGGGILLDHARAGRDFKAFVVFHITYPGTADPAGAAKVKGRVLVLHGADDPVSPRKTIAALEDEFDAAKVRWETVMFSNTVHSFTDPTAHQGATRYDPEVAKRAYAAMRDFFKDAL